MTDWAELEARKLTAAWRPVADALRRARADGMREAAQLCVSDLGEGDIDFIAFKLRLAADKIEHPLAHNDGMGHT